MGAATFNNGIVYLSMPFYQDMVVKIKLLIDRTCLVIFKRLSVPSYGVHVYDLVSEKKIKSTDLKKLPGDRDAMFEVSSKVILAAQGNTVKVFDICDANAENWKIVHQLEHDAPVLCMALNTGIYNLLLTFVL